MITLKYAYLILMLLTTAILSGIATYQFTVHQVTTVPMQACSAEQQAASKAYFKVIPMRLGGKTMNDLGWKQKK